MIFFERRENIVDMEFIFCKFLGRLIECLEDSKDSIDEGHFNS